MIKTFISKTSDDADSVCSAEAALLWKRACVGARLARDAGNSVYQAHRGDAIAGKPCSHTNSASTSIDVSDGNGACP
ncbi:hypothetical protein FGE05_16690 [Pseudomonas sp. ICMP22404]|nr:hypothetical protein FGE05_16690 [Pseudomonas sp. ICMP22404]